MNATITALLEKHLNATLTAAEAKSLALAMAENPALAEEFAGATRMEADISATVREKGRTALYTRRMERAAAETEHPRVRRPWPVKTMAAAAGIAALIGFGWRLMVGEPVSISPAKKSPPASPLASAGDGRASFSSDSRPRDASAMKRKLRRFASGVNRLRSVPVSQALATLQTEWKNGAHTDAKDQGAVFVLADGARQLWQKPGDEPAVSLEIPGISLLTSLELIAAQAGLKATVTDTGVSLEPQARHDDGKERTWNIPLSAASVTAFISSVSSRRQEVETWGMRGMSGRWMQGRSGRYTVNSISMNPSWMEQPPQTVATNAISALPGAEFQANPLNTFKIWTALTAVAASQPTGAAVLDLQLQDAAETALRTSISSATGTMVPGSDLFVSEILHPQATGGMHEAQDGLPGESGQPSGSTFELIAEVAAFNNSADYTFDRNLAPEFTEFDGFINYGEPVVSGGQVLLTDSGITQPVFATPVLMDYPANVTRLLAAHGIPAAAATWDPEIGVIKARGPLSQLRAAHAAAAAIEEAASAGVTVEMKVIEWHDGLPAAVADRSGLLPPPASGPTDTLTPDAAADLLGDPALEHVSGSRQTQQLNAPLTLKDTKLYPITASTETVGNIEAGVTADVSGITRSGFSWHLPVNVRRSGLPRATPATDDGSAKPNRETSQHHPDVQLQDGEWLRVDFPATGDTKAATVLLSIQPATVQP